MPSSYGPLMGGAGGPVIAEGKVFFFYMWPSGAVDQALFDQMDKDGRDVKSPRMAAMAKDMGMPPEDLIRLKSMNKTDDVIIAMDLKTGKTLWKQVFKERGNNPGKCARSFFKFAKDGPHIIACAAYGKVATVGGAGDFYCIDASTGKVLWEKKSFRSVPVKHSICNGSPTFGGGLFIAAKSDKALVGLDPATGEEKWTAKIALDSTTQPVRWVKDDQECIIAGTSCIDAKTGKVLWTAVGASTGGSSPVIQGDLVVFGGAGASGLNCYQLALQGATKVWALDANYSSGFNTPSIINGTVYSRGKGKDWKYGGRPAFICTELATGKILSEITNNSDDAGSMIGIGDLLVDDGQWFNANPKDFKLLGVGPEPLGDFRSTFAASHTPSPAGGSMIIIRGRNSLRCYDLAAQADPPPAAPAR